MNKLYMTHDETMTGILKRSPELAAELLNQVLADGSQEEIMLTLRQIAAAYGIQDIAQKAELNKRTIYRTLSAKGNPELRTFRLLLNAMGYQLSVTPLTVSA